MHITTLNLTKTINFTARNKNIKKADDMQRRMVQTFPMLSPSYMDTFYSTVKMTKHDEPVNPEARRIFKKADKKLTAVREIAKEPEKYGIKQSKLEQSIPYTQLLDGIKLMKVGNCEEKAIAMLAALCANGYYNSERVCLYLETRYINKETGKTEYKALDSLDHSFVITELENDNKKNKIVIDPWLGFTDSISGAKAKYKQIYDETSIKNIISYHRSMFRLRTYENTGKLIKPEDYELRRNFIFYSPDTLTEENLKDLGLYSRIMFENLLMPKKEQ